MTRILTILAALICIGSTHAASAEEESPIFERFLGEWRSDGQAFGAPADTVMVWTRTLGGRFYRIDYHIEMRRDGQTSVFEGVGHYRADRDGAADGYWADNSGDLHPIRAETEGAALVSYWGVEGEKYGRTRYELAPSGEMQVTDWIMSSDGWRQFNKNTFERSDDTK